MAEGVEAAAMYNFQGGKDLNHHTNNIRPRRSVFVIQFQ